MSKKSFLFSIILIFITSLVSAKEYSPGVDKIILKNFFGVIPIYTQMSLLMPIQLVTQI